MKEIHQPEGALQKFIDARQDPVRYPLGPFFGEYSESGVDLSLLRHMLSLTPLQRVERMEQFARETQQILEYGRNRRESNAGSSG